MHDALGEVLAKRRVRAVLPHIRGRLLDVGCGFNRLVRNYENGIGVDVWVVPADGSGSAQRFLAHAASPSTQR